MHAQSMRLKISTGFFAALALWLSSDAHSEVYRWVDDSGKAHYRDRSDSSLAHASF